MKIQDIVSQLSLETRTCKDGLNNDITGVYVSDLLSDVMAKSSEGHVWITLQTHMNIVAVASMKNLSGIIIVNNRQPQEDVITKAETERITIMTTPLPGVQLRRKINFFSLTPRLPDTMNPCANN
jgi:hypothetical protein